MRFINAFKTDTKFQFKQGFYLIYIILTLIYMIAVSKLPDNINSIIVPLIIFSDPSVIGFFFIGGIIMLEKGQGVLELLTITPLKTKEYLISKVISLTLVATFAGTLIAMINTKGGFDIILLIIGIILCSTFFTLYGVICAAGCKTMNQYFVRMIPYMIIIIIPCFGLIDFKYSYILNFFPSLASLRIIYGAFTEKKFISVFPYILYMLIINFIFFKYTVKYFEKKIVYEED